LIVRLRVRDGLHAALQLNQDNFNARRSFASGSVLHGAMQRSRVRSADRQRKNCPQK
jgi:hypothetical protein